jgi:hypothetical protein
VFGAPQKYEGRKGRCPKCGGATAIVDIDRLPPGDSGISRGRDSATLSREPKSTERPTAAEGMTRPKLQRAKALEDTADDFAPLVKSAGEPATVVSTSGKTHETGAPAFPGIQIENESNAAGVHATRRRPSPTKSNPILLHAGLGGLALLLLLGGGGYGLYAIFFSGGDASQSTPGDNVAASGDTASNTPHASADGANESTGANSAAPETSANSAADLSHLAAQARRFTVRLRVSRPQGDTTCAGFYVNPSGWIATSWERLRGATGVHVQLDGQSESSLAAVGIVVEDRRTGVVLISAKPSRAFHVADLGAEQNLAPGDAMCLSAMPAWGDDWLSECSFVRHCPTGALPDEVLQQARGVMGEDARIAWLETQGESSADGAGGPLLDSAGKVVGVCLFADGARQRSFALPVQELVSLLEAARRASPRLQPFAPDGYVPQAVAFAPSQFDPGVPSPPADAPPASVADALSQRLTELKAQADSHQWLPASQQQYAVFQQLALELFQAASIADVANLPADQRTTIDEAVSAALRAELEWNDEAKRQTVNRLASQAIDGDASRGIYAFGEVTYPPGRISINGRTTIGLQLTGTRETVFMTVNFGGEGLRNATRWLIIGEYLGRIPDLSGDESLPGARRASLIRVKHLIGEPLAPAAIEFDGGLQPLQ